MNFNHAMVTCVPRLFGDDHGYGGNVLCMVTLENVKMEINGNDVLIIRNERDDIIVSYPLKWLLKVTKKSPLYFYVQAENYAHRFEISFIKTKQRREHGEKKKSRTPR